jgi:hypothetical protein
MNVLKSTVENIDGAITNGQSRETDKQKHTTKCVGQLYIQTNTNNVNKI